MEVSGLNTACQAYRAESDTYASTEEVWSRLKEWQFGDGPFYWKCLLLQVFTFGSLLHLSLIADWQARYAQYLPKRDQVARKQQAPFHRGISHNLPWTDTIKQSQGRKYPQRSPAFLDGSSLNLLLRIFPIWLSIRFFSFTLHIVQSTKATFNSCADDVPSYWIKYYLSLHVLKPRMWGHPWILFRYPVKPQGTAKDAVPPSIIATAKGESKAASSSRKQINGNDCLSRVPPEITEQVVKMLSDKKVEQLAGCSSG